jgi:dolichol-phosphate mannosyltransferase
MSPVKKISIACPIHNEEDSISYFYTRYLDIVKTIGKKYNVELIFSNNRSEDNSLAEILKLRQTDSSIQVITLSRNFGYQASLQALLSVVDCDALIFIDVDCEDPPEMILDFISKWEDGYKLVYGKRVDRVENLIIKKSKPVQNFHTQRKTPQRGFYIVYMYTFYTPKMLYRLFFAIF